MTRNRALFALALSVLMPVTARAQFAADTSSVPAPTRTHDSLFGLDKPKHFLLSFFIESVSYSALQAAGAGRSKAIAGATGVTFVFAVGREIHDRRTKGLFSFGDLAWDALGTGAAMVMLRHTYK